MSLLDRLFGTPLERDVARIIRDADARVQATYGPLGELAKAIVLAAHTGQQQLASTFGIQAGGRPSEPQILLFYELLYFFTHLTLRMAVASSFTVPQIKKLQGFLGPLLASTAVDSFFRHWPEDRKAGIEHEFFERLNDAERDYAECRALVSQGNPLDKNSLFGRLAGNAVALWERSEDIAAQAAVLSASCHAFEAMQLERLVGDVKPVIDSVDPEELLAFWRKSRA